MSTNLCDPVYLALTRPPLVAGVTHTFFFANFIGSLLFFLLSSSLYSVLFFIVFHLLGISLTFWDHNFFTILLSYVRDSLSCPNNGFWGANSYDPF